MPPELTPLDEVLKGTHYVVVCEFDCPEGHAHCWPRSGPFSTEQYLSPTLSSRDAIQEVAEKRFGRLGRRRIARLVFDDADGKPGLDPIAGELLSATRAWVEWMDSPGDGTNMTIDDEAKMLDAMRAAIAKAEGRAK